MPRKLHESRHDDCMKIRPKVAENHLKPLKPTVVYEYERTRNRTKAGPCLAPCLAGSAGGARKPIRGWALPRGIESGWDQVGVGSGCPAGGRTAAVIGSRVLIDKSTWYIPCMYQVPGIFLGVYMCRSDRGYSNRLDSDANNEGILFCRSKRYGLLDVRLLSRSLHGCSI